MNEQTMALTRREDFGGTEIAPIAETSAAAVAEAARARIEARAIIALRRPRNMDSVRVRLLKECDRPGFAAVARYRLPRGGKSIEGPTIRFAEACVRAMGNLDITTDVVYDAPDKRIVRVAVVDLETNAAYSSDVTIEKVLERSRLKDGQQPIGTRTNSAGQVVYLVAADEGELLVKQAALVSKALRNGALRLLPGDILEECMDGVVATMQREDKRDPDAARKRVVDAFAKIGVMPEALATYLGHDLAASSPAEMDELRAIYAGIDSGDATWTEIMAERLKVQNGDGPPNGGKVGELKQKLADKKAAKGSGKPAANAPSASSSPNPSACDGQHGDPSCGPGCYLAPPPA